MNYAMFQFVMGKFSVPYLKKPFPSAALAFTLDPANRIYIIKQDSNSTCVLDERL